MSVPIERAKSFEEAVAPYECTVYFTCLGMMGNPHDAQDCAQEAMLKAYKSFSGFRGDSKLSTWLYTIASRCCLDSLHNRKENLSLDSLREAGWERADPTPSPYLQLEASERSRLLRLAIGELSPMFRQAITLCDIQELSYEQAAEIIACPVGTIRSRLNRARMTLKKILKTNPELFSTNESLIDERRETV